MEADKLPQAFKELVSTASDDMRRTMIAFLQNISPGDKLLMQSKDKRSQTVNISTSHNVSGFYTGISKPYGDESWLPIDR